LFRPDWRLHSLPALTPDDPFIFLTYSQGCRRKDAEMAVSAFMKTFGTNPRYQLWIKARDGYQGTWLDGVKHLPNVRIIGGKQAWGEWVNLLHQAHCLIFPTRGEGIGYVGRDAVQAGLPTITTQWLGQYDADQWAYPIRVSGLWECSLGGRFYATAKGTNQWANPDTDQLAQTMRYVVDHYTEAVGKTAKGREYLGQQKYADVAKKIVNLLDVEEWKVKANA
jgi:glycosyltransferase involved in cell wall biosynthesis